MENFRSFAEELDETKLLNEIKALKQQYPPPPDNKYLAPNGTQSKLNPDEWYAVRTLSFKERYGDWGRLARIEYLQTTIKKIVNGEKFVRVNDLRKDVTIQLEICRKPSFQGIFEPFRVKFAKNFPNSVDFGFCNSLSYKELAMAEQLRKDLKKLGGTNDITFLWGNKD